MATVTNTSIITAIHVTLDAALIAAGGDAIPYEIGHRERSKNARQVRIVWDDSGSIGEVGKVSARNPNPQAVAYDIHGWEVVMWSEDRDDAEALLHAFVAAGRKTYGVEVVRFGRYRCNPEAAASKGFVVRLEAQIELPVDGTATTFAFVKAFADEGLILPSEEVVITSITPDGFGWSCGFDSGFS